MIITVDHDRHAVRLIHKNKPVRLALFDKDGTRMACRHEDIYSALVRRVAVRLLCNQANNPG